MIVAIGSDHAGYIYKTKIKSVLENQAYKVYDFGTFSNESVDYPDFIHPVCDFIEIGNANFGIILCGSGNGAAITANKHKKIRAALVWNEKIAILSREHNNANIISIPARFISLSLSLNLVKIFLETKFNDIRHQIRIDKISNI